MVFLALGAAASPSYAAALFLAAYVLGMLRAGDDIFSYGNGLLEAAVILALSLIFITPDTLFFALLVLLAVQLADDLMDYDRDNLLPGQGNLALRFGRGEAVLALLIVSLTVLSLDTLRTLLIVPAVPVSLYTAKFLERKISC